MLKLYSAGISALVLGLILATQAAFAQRPPSPSQGPPQMSLERAWQWLMARPGVLVALAIIIAAVLYMVLSRNRSKT